MKRDYEKERREIKKKIMEMSHLFSQTYNAQEYVNARETCAWYHEKTSELTAGIERLRGELERLRFMG